MDKNSSFRRVWTALRFIVFGVFGFIGMMSGLVILQLDMSVLDHKRGYVASLELLATTILVAVLGAVMMLYGAGEWGRWGYLLVFLSIPISFFLAVPAGKYAGIIVPMLASVGTYIAVRTYYARPKSRALSDRA